MDNIIYDALELCIAKRIPFAIYRHPADRKPTFFSNPSLLSAVDHTVPEYGFFINEFAEDHTQNHWIAAEYDAQKTLKRKNVLKGDTAPIVEPWGESTPKEYYIESVNALIDKLKNKPEGSKTVISIASAKFRPDTYLPDTICNVFDEYPQCFCYAFYHPATGFWVGASPELLASVHRKDEVLTTAAVAGTMDGDDDREWSQKNIVEHTTVVKYITDVLKSFGIPHCVMERETQYVGQLKHLRTMIISNICGVDTFDVIDKLSPTPALAGFPLDEALAEIAEIERHPRRCYGGYVGYRDKERIEAYVTIRCAQVQMSKYCFYSGGGILKDSNAEEEWAEACAKRESLESII